MEARQKTGKWDPYFAKYLKDADYVQKKDITIYTDEKRDRDPLFKRRGTRLKASMEKQVSGVMRCR